MQYCNIAYCDREATTRVPVSPLRNGGKVGAETRELCAACERAYTIGVQHGSIVALGGLVVEVKGGVLEDVRCSAAPHYPIAYAIIERDDQACGEPT